MDTHFTSKETIVAAFMYRDTASTRPSIMNETKSVLKEAM